ncbi:hypothetical protein [Candidatus Methanodesulfokora washburnensis]|uniref:hypothetical protein n=1 Tax=Candidatus Methanodesulfokora washburnensis TaxID=2478471 RepID=UPI0013873854|nr:hypothetical protein [Candidatus Methanodesulfokores washburnensis]
MRIRKRIVKCGRCYAVILPRSWIEHLRHRGIDITEADMEIGGCTIKIFFRRREEV